MSNKRAIGYYLYKNPQYRDRIILEVGLNDIEYERLLEGRISLIYSDLIKVSNIIGIPVRDLITMENDNCYKGMIHTEGNFSNQENCEKILDLIDSYIYIKEAVDRYC